MAKRQKHKKSKASLNYLPVILVILFFAGVFITLQTFEYINVNGIPTWHEIIADFNDVKDNGLSAQTPVPQDGEATVHVIDVGQGNSTLILGDDFSLLMDAGESGYGDTVVNYLQDRGVTSLDYVVASHPHADHIGGMAKVLQAFEVDTFFMPDLPDSMIPTTKTYENMLDALEGNGCAVEPASFGEWYTLGEGATFQFIGPSGEFDDLNNMSSGIRFRYGDTVFNVMGDMEKEAEEALLEQNWDLSADVLMLGHHGSRTSSTQELLDAVGATYYVAQCGYDNTYGHPHNETVAKIMGLEGVFLRSDLQGTIVFYTDGKDLTLYEEKKVG